MSTKQQTNFGATIKSRVILSQTNKREETQKYNKNPQYKRDTILSDTMWHLNSADNLLFWK